MRAQKLGSRWGWGVGLGAAVLALTVGLAGAATLTVTDFGDSGAPGQLRTLINQAEPGDTIVIGAAPLSANTPKVWVAPAFIWVCTLGVGSARQAPLPGFV